MQIYTDGSFNIGKNIGAWAVVVTVMGELVETKNGTQTDSTSNRMEMVALIEALKYANYHLSDNFLEEKQIIIYSDSNYNVQGYNKWMNDWKKKGWKTANSGLVKNQDLWLIIDSLRHPNISVEWVKGHNGNEFNELADSLTKIY